MPKPKVPCPHCGKEFVVLKSHITKTHKRDKWRIVVPMNLENEFRLLHFGEEIGRETWSAGSDEHVEVCFGLTDALRETIGTKAICIAVTIPTTGEEKSLVSSHTGEERVYAVFPSDKRGWEPIDRLTWTVVYE